MIIGISGYSTSGKDSVADYMVSGLGYKRLSFATALKDMLYAINPDIRMSNKTQPLQTLVDNIGWDEAKKDIRVRELLQRVGVAGREIIYENVWLDIVLEQAMFVPKVVIPDTRFKNEAAGIKNQGGYVIRVNRPECGPINNHISETDLDNFTFDKFIDNRMDLDYLHLMTNASVRELELKHLGE